MRSVIIFVLAGLLGLVGATAQSNPAVPEASANALRLEADVRFLSHDLLEGREAGTRGYDLAALYVAEAYRAIGLDPGGDEGTYFQQVPLREDRYDPDGVAQLSLSKGDRQIEMVENVDYFVLSASKATKTIVEAPAVFAGFGLVAEEHDRDDFASLDVEGKIVFLIAGAPKFLNSEERAYYGSINRKNASDRGAIGAVGIFTDTFEKRISFPRLVEYWTNTSSMNWLDGEGRPFSLTPNIQATAVLSQDGAALAFADGEHDWSGIHAAAESNAGEVPGFDLGLTARIEIESIHRELESPNVIGILPGSDPALRDEYVVLTAHLDHDGIRPSDDPDDDEIFNGAMDNAVGVAAMIEVARMLSVDPPRRSVVFIALAAEEKGLEGSDYYARNPTVPAESMVAVVNLDMPIMTYDFSDLIAYGVERSTLLPVVEAAVKALGLTLSPDPAPDMGIFTRSDHYSFVQQGIPAVYLSPGIADGGKEAQAEFLATHYHRVSDEVRHVDFDALTKFSNVKYSIAKGIANMATRPVWKRGDFFGRTFDGPMEE